MTCLNWEVDFEASNFKRLDTFFEKLENTPYSLNSVEKIINKIDLITTNEEYKTINAYVDENISDKNKINLKFVIEETEKFFVGYPVFF